MLNMKYNGETMKAHKPWLIPLITALTLFGIVNIAGARIPEPDNIVYGMMPAGNSLFSLKINEEIIAQYTRGENQNAGEFFILRVPIDSLDPQEAGTARTGNQVSIYLDAEAQAAVMVTVGERGAVQRVFLASANDDGDTKLNGVDNCPDIANDQLDADGDQLDSDGDGQGDACDGNSDTDRDGYTDMQEYANKQASETDANGQQFYPLTKNVSGGTGYRDPQNRLLVAIKLLQILTGSAIDCPECVIDIGNDDVLGPQEAVESVLSAADL
jgi:hypothetical protein